LDVSLNIRKAARMPPKGKKRKKIGADKIENEGGDVPLEANGDTARLPKKKRTKGSDGSLKPIAILSHLQKRSKRRMK